MESKLPKTFQMFESVWLIEDLTQVLFDVRGKLNLSHACLGDIVSTIIFIFENQSFLSYSNMIDDEKTSLSCASSRPEMIESYKGVQIRQT